MSSRMLGMTFDSPFRCLFQLIDFLGNGVDEPMHSQSSAFLLNAVKRGQSLGVIAGAFHDVRYAETCPLEFRVHLQRREALRCFFEMSHCLFEAAKPCGAMADVVLDPGQLVQVLDPLRLRTRPVPERQCLFETALIEHDHRA